MFSRVQGKTIQEKQRVWAVSEMTFKRSTLYGYAKQGLSDCSLLFQTSYESWMISDMTQFNAITVNDTCFEICDCPGNFCSYFIWEMLVLYGKCHHVLQWAHFPQDKKKSLRATHQLFKECFKILALFSETASHPFPHLEGCADNTASHYGSKVLSHHPPMYFSHQDLSWQCERNSIAIINKLK